MVKTPRAFFVPIGMLTLALVASPLSAVAAQTPQSGEQQAQPQTATQAPTQTQAPAQKAETVKGELISVDSKASTFMLKPAEGAEQRFQYNNETKITGAQGGVAGLATMSGRQLTVQFTMQGANRLASSIEILPQAGQSQSRPQQPSADQPQARPQQPGADQPRSQPGAPPSGQPER